MYKDMLGGGVGGGGILPQKMSCRKTRLGEMHRRQHT